MIPKRIHLIWLGTPFPEKFIRLRNRIAEINHDYEIMEWRDDNINFELQNFQLFGDTKNFGSKSDILRMEILYKYGGIYMDYDFYQCKKFDDLLSYDFVIGSAYENELWNGLMMSKPESEIVKCYLNTIKDNIPNCGDIMYTTGPFKVKEIFTNNTFSENIKVLYGDYFYPFDLGQRHKVKDITSDNIEFLLSFKTNNTYCIHIHTCTWQ